jgi:hypothetical protein
VTPKRTTPLSAPDAGSFDEIVLDEDIVLDDDDVATEPDAERQERFARGVRELRVGSVSVVLSERILLVLGGIIAPLGLVVVVLGWWGASQTPYLFEQVPYLISGGLLGVALVFLGSFFYFTHWLTELVKEHRAQSEAIVAALERLQKQVANTD